MREAPCTLLIYTAVRPVNAVTMTIKFPYPQYAWAIGVTAVSPRVVYSRTCAGEVDNVKAHEFRAQNTAIPITVSRIALGKYSRGACASSAAVDTTSKPQKARTPRIMALQNPEKPFARCGLKGERLIAPGCADFATRMV